MQCLAVYGLSASSPNAEAGCCADIAIPREPTNGGDDPANRYPRVTQSPKAKRPARAQAVDLIGCVSRQPDRSTDCLVVQSVQSSAAGPRFRYPLITDLDQGYSSVTDGGCNAFARSRRFLYGYEIAPWQLSWRRTTSPTPRLDAPLSHLLDSIANGQRKCQPAHCPRGSYCRLRNTAELFERAIVLRGSLRCLLSRAAVHPGSYLAGTTRALSSIPPMRGQGALHHRKAC